MIRAGRAAVDAAQIGLWHNPPLSLSTLYSYGLLSAPGFPTPVSSPHARRRLWDARQARAAITGAPVPPLPEFEDHEDDLLDRGEAPLLLRRPVSPATWDRYVADAAFLRERAVRVPGKGRRDQETKPAALLGVVHHRRGDILAWDATRAVRGRLHTAAGVAQQARAQGRTVSGAQIARALNVSERTGARLLKRLKEAGAPS